MTSNVYHEWTIESDGLKSFIITRFLQFPRRLAKPQAYRAAIVFPIYVLPDQFHQIQVKSYNVEAAKELKEVVQL